MDDGEEEMVVQQHCSHFFKHQFSTDSTEIDVLSLLILKVCEFYFVVEIHVRRKMYLCKIIKTWYILQPNSEISNIVRLQMIFFISIKLYFISICTFIGTNKFIYNTYFKWLLSDY